MNANNEQTSIPHSKGEKTTKTSQCICTATFHLRKGCHCQSTGGKRLYSITDVHKVFGDGRQPTQKAKVCYARVSSEHQRDDLERQITDLRQRYPGHEIISDIGSGL